MSKIGIGDSLSVKDIVESVIEKLEARILHPVESAILPNKTDLEQSAFDSRRQLPEEGLEYDQALSTIAHQLAPGLNLSSLSPRYYGFVTGGATPAALAADILTSIYDQNVSVHLPEETVATEIEVQALNMLLDLLLFDRKAFPTKTFTTGATASNILGLALGREWILQAYGEQKGITPLPSVGELGLLEACSQVGISKIEVVSTLPHSSIVKAAGVVGLGRNSIVDLSGTDGSIALVKDQLLKHVTARESTTATILVLSVGEVNTGHFATSSLSDMEEIRNICNKHKIWIHADGAFGLFARLLIPSPGPPDANLLNDTVLSRSLEPSSNHFHHLASSTLGLSLVDSITGDSHKFLNVPYDCGFFFSRHPVSLSESVFQNGNAAYLAPPPPSSSSIPTSADEQSIPSPLNIRLENSSRFRGLPVYTTLLSHGRRGYRKILTTQINLARKISSFISSHPSYTLLPEIPFTTTTTDKTFIIVLFRHKSPQSTLNKTLVSRIKATGRIYASSTVWDRAPAARLAVCNWRVDVERDFEVVREVLEGVLVEDD